MQKKELSALSFVRELTPQMIITPANYTPCRWDYSDHYYYSADVDGSTGEEILIINLYSLDTMLFVTRFFTDGARWFQIDGSGKLSTASLHNYNLVNWRRNHFYPIDSYCDGIIHQFFIYRGTEYLTSDDLKHYEGIDLVVRLCDKVRAAQNDEKFRRRRASIENELREVKEPPQAFFDWIDQTVMAFSQYLFVEMDGKKREVTAHCSCCGNQVKIPKPRIGDITECPACKAQCRVKSYKRFLSSYGFEDACRVSYVQPLSGNRFCIHDFDVRRRYIGGAAKRKNDPVSVRPKQIIWEQKRTIFRFGAKGGIEFSKAFEPARDSRLGDWQRSESDCTQRGFIFPDTLNGIFKNAPCFKAWHLDYNRISSVVEGISADDLYRTSLKIACLHNVVEAGLTRLARDIIIASVSFNLESKKGALRKALDITKDDLRILQAINPDEEEFRMYRAYKRSGRKIIREDLVDFFKIAQLMNLSEHDMKTILKRSSLHQWNRFVEQNFPHFRTDASAPRYRNFKHDYEDYISAALKLRYDLTDRNVLYPKNLKHAHDAATEIVTDKEFKKGELPEIAKQYHSYKKFCFEDENFILTPPKRHADLKWEGKLLNHCVASYAKNIAKGNTIILFIRRKSEPDRPYFTLNIAPKTYKQIQCRGQRNCDYPPEVAEFMKKWRKEVITPLKKEEKKCQKATS